MLGWCELGVFGLMPYQLRQRQWQVKLASLGPLTYDTAAPLPLPWGKVTLARSVPSWASDPCPLHMHEGDPLISFVGKRPLPMHEGDPLIWDGLPRPRTHDDPAIGDFRSQMSSMHVGILLGT